MKKVKQLKGWGIYELNAKEQIENNFVFAVIHPDNIDCPCLEPCDTDIELETLQQAIYWIKNY